MRGVLRPPVALAASFALILALAACESSTPTPSASSATAAHSPSPSPIAQTLRVVSPITSLLGGPGTPVVNGFLHAQLFRLDTRFDAVPELADGPCVASADELTMTCGIRAATFHDGSPVTVDDVAFSLGLGLPPCANGLWCGFGMTSVKVVDDRHVAVQLERRSAAFTADVLASFPILPRHAIEASFERFMAKARQADLPALEAASKTIEDTLGAARPDCDSVVPPAERLLGAAGVTAEFRTDYAQSDGSYDVCAYAGSLSTALQAVVAAVGDATPDAVRKAFRLLDFQVAPVGAGPWRLERLDPGRQIVLRAFDGFSGGRPAIDRVEITIQPDVGAAIDETVAGRVDWLDLAAFQAADLGDGYAELKRAPGQRLLSFPDFGFYTMMYNLRPGRLFRDPRLREAVERCIDKVAAVDAATAGEGIAVDSWVSPASFAYLEPGAPQPRDVDAAKVLIEAAGWRLGSDGVYRRPNGRRLAFDVPVRSDTPDRIKFLDLIAFQLKDCGIDLRPKPISFDLLGPMTGTFPHLVPGTKTPFEAYFGGWGMSTDPGGVEFFETRNITSANPSDDPDYYGINYIGYSNPKVDALILAGRTTLDPKQRARIYKELQQLIKADRPYLFAWSALKHESITTRLSTLDGPLDADSPFWSWAPERWVLDPQ